MKSVFLKTWNKNSTISLPFISLLIVLTFGRLYALDGQWTQVREADYADVLDRIALSAKANYEEISSWQGRMNILETKHYYGPNAVRNANVDANSIAGNSQNILETIRNTAEFVVDPRNDRLYSKKEKPQIVQLRAIDLDQDASTNKNCGYQSLRAILTREQYIWYLPNSNFVSKFRNVRPGKMAFIERPEERKFGLDGDIRDPRIFFEYGGEGKTLWDMLLQFRRDINERIKARVAGYPQIEVSSLSGDKGTKYRILTTWRDGENYVTKYVRSLLEVDEAVGFNAVKTETTTPDSVRIDSTQYTYEAFGNIYVPKTIRKEYRNRKGEPTFASEITIETTGVNKPLPEDTFSIKNLGVEEGALVTDKIKNAEFRFRNGTLVPITDANQ
jgi:hypothetical protein